MRLIKLSGSEWDTVTYDTVKMKQIWRQDVLKSNEFENANYLAGNDREKQRRKRTKKKGLYNLL